MSNKNIVKKLSYFTKPSQILGFSTLVFFRSCRQTFKKYNAIHF